MTLRKLALAAALALACAPAAFAQTASTLSVKDSTGATQTLAGQLDALSRFHYRDVMEGLTSGGAPDPLVTDGAGHALFSLYGSPAVSVSNFPTTQTVSGSVAITGTLPAFAAPPTFNFGTLNGAATAAAQTAVQSAPGTSASTAVTIQGSATGVGIPVTGPLTAAQLTTAAIATSANQQTEITAEQAQAAAAGTPADAAYTTGSGTTIALLKAQLAAALAGPTGTAQSSANGSLTAIQAAEASNVVHAAYSTALGASATYTGGTRDATSAVSTGVAVSYFNAIFYADQTGTAYIDLSDDGATWTPAVPGQALTALTPLTLTAPILARYYRARLVNGATAQTTLRVSSAFARN